MDNHDARVTPRRRALRRLGTAAGAAACASALGLIPVSRSVAAEPASKASKAAVQYQDHPDGTSSCATCANFIPGPDAKAPGTCLVVAGAISPQGWCLAYAAKS